MVLLFLYDVKTLGIVIMKLRLEKYKVVHYYSDVIVILMRSVCYVY